VTTVRDSDVRAAAERLRGLVVATPLVPSPWLSRRLGSEVRLKLENVQPTGSFKLRGATHALLRLPADARARGVVAASSGNHGLGVAFAAARLGVRALVFVPASAAPEKRAAIAAHGARVEVHGDDCVDTERHARSFAAEHHQAYVSPYNDADVVAGQGSVAVELLAQWPEVERVYVAVGGGGLIGGMAVHGRAAAPGVEWIAASPSRSPAMAECVRRGRIVDVPCGDTWSDSTAGGVEPDAITFPLCRDLVDRFVDVDEPAIERAMLECLQQQHLLVEGAAGVAIAACLADAVRGAKPSAIVVCGGNVPVAALRRLLARA
jgi:threonine dehydratase